MLWIGMDYDTSYDISLIMAVIGNLPVVLGPFGCIQLVCVFRYQSIKDMSFAFNDGEQITLTIHIISPPSLTLETIVPLCSFGTSCSMYCYQDIDR